MKQLPLKSYEPAVWSSAKVPLDYLIFDGKNKYSVPYDLMEDCADNRESYQLQVILFRVWAGYFPQQSMCTDFYVLDNPKS